MLWSNSLPDLCCCIQDTKSLGLMDYVGFNRLVNIKVFTRYFVLLALLLHIVFEYLGNCNFSSSCLSFMFTGENVFHWNCTNYLLLGHGWQVGDTYIICAQRVILRGHYALSIFSSLVYGR